MSIVGYGYGRDTDIVGGAVAYGLGIVGLLPVINAAISFNTNLDIATVNSLTVDKDISFSLDLLLSIVKQLEIDQNIIFDLETAVEVATQNNVFNPDIEFNTELGSEFIKQLITDANIDFDTQLTQDQATFLIEFILDKFNVYVVPEELRFLKVFTELRTCEVSEESRAETVKFEDRVVVAPQQEEN